MKEIVARLFFLDGGIGGSIIDKSPFMPPPEMLLFLMLVAFVLVPPTIVVIGYVQSIVTALCLAGIDSILNEVRYHRTCKAYSELYSYMKAVYIITRAKTDKIQNTIH